MRENDFPERREGESDASYEIRRKYFHAFSISQLVASVACAYSLTEAIEREEGINYLLAGLYGIFWAGTSVFSAISSNIETGYAMAATSLTTGAYIYFGLSR